MNKHVHALFLIWSYLSVTIHARQLPTQRPKTTTYTIIRHIDPLFVSITMCNDEYKPLVELNDISLKVAQTVQYCSNNRFDIIPEIFSYSVSLPYCTFEACDYMMWKHDITTIVDSLLEPEHFYPYRIYVFPDISSCSWGGLAPIGCLYQNGQCTILIQGTAAQSPISYLHEIGHTLGLTHSYAINSTTNEIIEYGDITCAMGLCCSERCFNAPHTAQIGWVHPSYTITDIPSGYTTYELSINQPYIVIQTTLTREWIHIHVPIQNVSNTDTYSDTHSDTYSDTYSETHIYTSPIHNPLGSHVVLQTTLYVVGDAWKHSSSQIMVRFHAVDLSKGITTIGIHSSQ